MLFGDTFIKLTNEDFSTHLQNYKKNPMSLGDIVTFKSYEDRLCFSMCLMLYVICASITMKPQNIKPKLHSKEKPFDGGR